jgi:ABC-2 type transport system ATP-binding protein
MAATAIEIKSLTKTYGRSRVVEDCSLSIPGGQVLGLLGPNDAGKTTILKLIAGLLVPDAGSVRLNGYDLVHEREVALQQVVAVVQGIRQLDKGRSVWQNLSPAARRGGEYLLRELGLWKCRDLSVDHLSHGFQQRVALARALSAGVPILLLDEPTLGLDMQAARAVETWIARLACEQGKTVVVASCHRQPVHDFVDRVVVMERGRLVADVLPSSTLGLSTPATYRIRVKGALGARWTAWFDGLAVAAVDDETVISGLVIDQPTLHSLLIKIRDLGLPLISVNRIEPGLEAWTM